eukprot:gene38715-47069_t
MAKQVVGADMVGRKGLLGNEDRTLEDDELVWIQCARLLLTLTQPELNDLCTCLKKILNNLIDHPGEEKFSSLKFSNEHLKRHLFGYNGGKEILMGVGFRSDMLIDGKGGEEKMLRLPVGYAQHLFFGTCRSLPLPTASVSVLGPAAVREEAKILEQRTAAADEVFEALDLFQALFDLLWRALDFRGQTTERHGGALHFFKGIMRKA